MGAGADAGIFAVAPVDEVVARFGARPGVVRDLVGRQAVRLADLLRHVVEDPRLVVVGTVSLPALCSRSNHVPGSMVSW